jgi:hypothetical protein
MLMTNALPRIGLFWTLTLALACGRDDPATTNTTADATTTNTTGTTGSGTTTSPTTSETSEAGASTSPTDGAASSSTGGECVTGFICLPDLGGGEVVECDVFEQDCKEGEKCVAWGMGGGSAWNATRCTPVTGDGQPGDDCSAPEGGLAGVDDCGAGSFCWDVFDNKGVCVALCTGTLDAPMCNAESTCLISNDGVLNLCLPSCDPLVQDCAGDDLCVPSGDGFLCSQDASGDGGQTNDACQGGNVCDKGLLCINTGTASSACDPNSTGCCQPYCEFPGSPCPNPDQQCVQWFAPDQFPPDDPRLAIGFCGIPQ